MNIYSKIFQLRTAFTICLAMFLSACGGGSSDSGGPPAPVAPPLTLFTVGLYSGSLNSTVSGQNVTDGGGADTIVLEVQGGVAGSQQVRIAFAQFSGTSAIGQDGEFSIPSGIFPLRVSNRNGRTISTCRGELLFEGTFSGTSVSGNVMTTTEFTCDRSRFGPLTLTGTFEATQGAAKLAGFGSDITVMASDL